MQLNIIINLCLLLAFNHLACGQTARIPTKLTRVRHTNAMLTANRRQTNAFESNIYNINKRPRHFMHNENRMASVATLSSTTSPTTTTTTATPTRMNAANAERAFRMRKSPSKNTHTLNKKLLKTLGFTKIKAPNSHNRKRLAIESRYQSNDDDSHMFIIKLAPNMHYYTNPNAIDAASGGGAGAAGGSGGDQVATSFKTTPSLQQISHHFQNLLQQQQQQKQQQQQQQPQNQQQEVKASNSNHNHNNNHINISNDNDDTNKQRLTELTATESLSSGSNTNDNTNDNKNNEKKVSSFGFSWNGRLNRIYHWNLPVIKKLLNDKHRFPHLTSADVKNDLIDIKHVPTWSKPWENEAVMEKSFDTNDYKKSLKRKSPSYYAPTHVVNNKSFNKYFAGNGKPKGFYVIKENQKKPYYHQNIIS